jgi:hypothetical protein
MVAVFDEWREINCTCNKKTHRVLLRINSKGTVVAGFTSSITSRQIPYTCPSNGQLMQANFEFRNPTGQKINSAIIVRLE